MINFIQPYSFELNIGKAYNEACEPLEGWICITDQDTLKFDGFARRVKEITDNAMITQVITCRTNRIRADNENIIHGLNDESDIGVHLKVFDALWEEHGAKLDSTRMPIVGMCMIFHSSVWEKVKFIEEAINFDSLFTTHCKQAGFTTHVAKGLYIFHLYRWGKEVGCVDHLIMPKKVIIDKNLLHLRKYKDMRTVKTGFFCIQTGVTYKRGDPYKGKRTDLEHVLVEEQEKKEAHVKAKEKVERKPKAKKIKRKTKKK